MSALTDVEYEAALANLAEYERRIVESDRLAQRDSLQVAAVLDQLYRDERWVEERNAERATTAKTARGGRPVDPTSRSQFSTWLRGRFSRIAPSTTYRLLDAQSITTSFLANGEITPTAESQVRPLKSLLSVANGQGARIPDVWDLACKLAADAGRDQPTSEDVKRGIAEWRHIHLPPAQQRRERASSKWRHKHDVIVREFTALLEAQQLGTAKDTIAELRQLLLARRPARSPDESVG